MQFLPMPEEQPVMSTTDLPAAADVAMVGNEEFRHDDEWRMQFREMFSPSSLDQAISAAITSNCSPEAVDAISSVLRQDEFQAALAEQLPPLEKLLFGEVCFSLLT
jgi:hypothetical protein